MTSSRTRRLDLPHALVRVDRTRIVLILCLLILAIVPESDARQTRGRVISHVVHASSLEDNLAGTTPDRNVHVYLPPSYDQDMDLRYPVVYVLSGIFDRATVWLEDWDGVDVEHATEEP